MGAPSSAILKITEAPQFSPKLRYDKNSVDVKHIEFDSRKKRSRTPSLEVPSKRRYSSRRSRQSRRSQFTSTSLKRHHRDRRRSRTSQSVSSKSISPARNEDKENHCVLKKGEKIDGRYSYIYESTLGKGTFGQVLLCRVEDKRLSNFPDFVALKMIRNVSRYRSAAQVEIDILKDIKDCDPYDISRCIHLLDSFTFRRRYVCMVTRVCGPSVYDFLRMNNYRPFPLFQIRQVAYDLFSSLSYLHDTLKLAHTDLKPENILFVHDECEQLVGADGRPFKQLIDTQIQLIDYGNATYEKEHHSRTIQTRHYRAPEVILQAGWSFPADIFSVGCILMEMYTGECLFQTHDNLEHLALIEKTLDCKTPSFYARFHRSYFKKHSSSLSSSSENYILDYPNKDTKRESKQCVNNAKSLKSIIHPEHIALFELISAVLAWKPEERPTARQALSFDFFRIL